MNANDECLATLYVPMCGGRHACADNGMPKARGRGLPAVRRWSNTPFNTPGRRTQSRRSSPNRRAVGGGGTLCLGRPRWWASSRALRVHQRAS